MTDIKMLPLPEADDSVENHAQWPIASECDVWLQDSVQSYARAVAEHNVKALRAEVAKQSAYAKRTHDWNTELLANNERLAEALRWYVENDDTNEGQEGNEYWLAGRDRAIAVLRDHDKEGTDDR